ncbi:CU044_5270 family protein [Micromonospora andamanensis]|uniref:CU044_5270 family protein n=1 Tax=Micromonospora andamanensis TaxID=1287068 RepID=UPI001EF2342F|nr:CU044_5270 family protein [Micromonospora andamanensis]
MANAADSGRQATLDQFRRPTRRRMAFLGTVGAAAAAVTAIAVAVAGPAVTPRDVPDAALPATRAPIDANPLLLVAAERSEEASQAGGRYLTIRSEHGVATPVTTADGTYTMFDRTGGQYWLARSDTDRSWVRTQSLGAVPAAPSDEAAWRRHGSPAVIRVTKPKPFDLRIAPGEVHGNTVDPEHLFALGDRNISQAQLDALPTDPAALRGALLSRFDGGGGDMPTDRDQWLTTVAAHLVIDLPVSNEVRAAAYRMLATMPGIRELGTVHDLHGRPGQAVAFMQDSPGIGRFEVRLIIDPGTGQALAEERRAVEPRGHLSWIKPGAISGYTLLLVSEATDASPPTVDATD